MKATFSILFLFFLTVSLSAQVASNSANPGNTYASVQAAVDAATNNYVVYIYANSITAGVTVSGKTNLTITKSPLFSGNPELKASSSGSGVGFQITASRNVTISNVAVAEFGQGMGLNGVSNRVFCCEIRSNAGYGVYTTAPGNNWTYLASNTIIAPNGYSGIEFSVGASNNTAISNRVVGSTYGATIGMIGTTASNRLINNDFDNNGNCGVFISNAGGGTVLSGNWIHSGGGNVGLLVYPGSFGLRIVSNTISGQDSGVNMTATTNFYFLSNTVTAQQSSAFNILAVSNGVFAFNELTAYPSASGLFLSSGSVGNLIASNYAHDLVGADAFGVGGAGTTGNTILSNLVVNVDNGISITSANNNLVLSNDIRGGSGVQMLVLNGTNNTVRDNAFRYSAGSTSVLIRGGSGNGFFANRVESNAGNGIVLSNGINNALTGNLIQVNGSKGIWLYAETNTVVASNSINNNPIGLQTDYLTQTPKIVHNDIHLNTQANLTNLVGASYYAVSNYYGSGNRAFSQKKISTSGPFTADPWLNGPIGVNGDFVLPAAMSSAVASNGLAAQVNLHWGPPCLSADFSRYFVYRTQTSNAYSNLQDSDLLTIVSSSTVTNYVDSPVAGGYYYYYVTVQDVNGNESWYSPQATVNYVSNDAPVASFTGPGPWITNMLATFTSTSFAGSGSITNYLWRFGDGSTLLGSNVVATHTYPTALTNFVSLTVFNNLGQSNTVSNQIIVYPLFLLSGPMSGTIQNGVTVNLASGATQMVTNSSASAYYFVVSNDTYSITPSKLGYRFQPQSRSVVIFNSVSTTNGFTSSDIYPILTFDNLKDQDKVIRDLSLNVTSDAPEILSTITYTISNLSPSNHFTTNLVSPYGTPAVFDTTLHPDGPYFIRALAVDTVFARPHTNAMTNIFNNGLFKVLDKDLENLKAIAYDTIRRPGKNETLELYFYIKENQKMKIQLYNKLGRTVFSYGEKDYFHGHNRLALDLPATLPTGPYYAVFECKEFTKTVLFAGFTVGALCASL